MFWVETRQRDRGQRRLRLVGAGKDRRDALILNRVAVMFASSALSPQLAFVHSFLLRKVQETLYSHSGKVRSCLQLFSGGVAKSISLGVSSNTFPRGRFAAVSGICAYQINDALMRTRAAREA